MMTPVERLRVVAAAIQPGVDRIAESEIDAILSRAKEEAGLKRAFTIDDVRTLMIASWFLGFIAGKQP